MTRVVVVVLVTGLLALTSACATRPEPRGTTDPALGLTVFDRAQRPRLPDLVGSSLTGRALGSRRYAAGSRLVVNVWASWCGPCRQELPLLARAARRGVRVLGIDERDSASRARAFARSRGASYPSLRDPDGRLLASLSLLPQAGIPSTLVVDPRGRVAARVVGPLSARSLARALARAAS